MGEPPTWGALVKRGLDPETLTHVGLNECPYPPSPKVVAAIEAEATGINRYPDHAPGALSAVVAERTGIDPARQVWGAGASDLILRTLRIAAHDNGGVVAPTPNFWGYERQYKACRTNVRRIEILADGQMDMDAMLGAVDANTVLMITVTPGNPSGSLLDEACILRLAKETPDHVLLLVDEVYQEFSRFVGGPDLLGLLQKHRTAPWIVLRSFSKSYAMAGIRVGYGLASAPEIATGLDQEGSNFSLTTLGLAAALAAYGDTDYTEQLVARITAQRDALSDGLRALGLAPLESYSNFVSVETPLPNKRLLEDLLDLGVVASAWSGAGWERYLRFTVGTEDDTKATLAALKRALAASSKVA